VSRILLFQFSQLPAHGTGRKFSIGFGSHPGFIGAGKAKNLVIGLKILG